MPPRPITLTSRKAANARSRSIHTQESMCGREGDRLPQRIDVGDVVRQQFFHLAQRVGVRRMLSKIHNTRFRRQIHEFVEQLSHFGSHRAFFRLGQCGGNDHTLINSGVTTLGVYVISNRCCLGDIVQLAILDMRQSCQHEPRRSMILGNCALTKRSRGCGRVSPQCVSEPWPEGPAGWLGFGGHPPRKFGASGGIGALRDSVPPTDKPPWLSFTV